MAQHQQGNGGNKYIVNWIRNNYIIKIFIFFLFFAFIAFLLLTMLQHSIDNFNGIKEYNKFAYFLSTQFNFLWFYEDYSKHFEAYLYYLEFKYEINQGFFEDKFWHFWMLEILESLPFFFAFLLFLPKFLHIKKNYEDYEEQLKWRNLKHIKEPYSELTKIIETEGTFGESPGEFSINEINHMKNIYYEREDYGNKIEGLLSIYKYKIKNNLFKYINSLEKLRKEYNTEEKWNTFFKISLDNNENLNNFLYIPSMSIIEWKKINEEEKEKVFEYYQWNNHFKFIQELNINVSKEMYIPSINKEVKKEELYEWYKIVLLFWLSKQTKNFSMHSYTINIDYPLEFKIMSKWTVGRNAPGQISVSTDTSVNRRDARTRISDIYYRLYHFKEFLGVECDYMISFLDRINKKLD